MTEINPKTKLLVLGDYAVLRAWRAQEGISPSNPNLIYVHSLHQLQGTRGAMYVLWEGWTRVSLALLDCLKARQATAASDADLRAWVELNRHPDARGEIEP